MVNTRCVSAFRVFLLHAFAKQMPGPSDADGVARDTGWAKSATGSVVSSRASVRLSDLIPTFTGHGDFKEWIRKVELLTDLQGVRDWQNFVPLFLW